MQAVIHAQTPSCFNSQPPEGGWCILFKAKKGHVRFQLTAARRRLDSNSVLSPKARKFQLTAARRRLGRFRRPFADIKISFNSQPPEGGWGLLDAHQRWSQRFNSQPPEGGWKNHHHCHAGKNRFNSQPPEGGWEGCYLLGLLH